MKPVMFCLDFCVDPQQMRYILFKTVEFWKTVPQIVTNIHIGKDLIGDNHVFAGEFVVFVVHYLLYA